MQATSGILLRDLVRPTSIQNTFSANNAGIPATVIYGSATSGQLNEQAKHIVPDNAPRRSKGEQGVFNIRSDPIQKFQPYKIDYRDTRREAFNAGQKGVVRSPEKWGWHARHFSITGIGLVA